MKKLICIFLLIFLSYKEIFSDENFDKKEPIKQSFFYGNFGLLLPFLPDVGLGYRCQKGKMGFDLGFDFSSLVALSTINAKPAFLFYFNPNLKSQFYAGIGTDIGYMFGRLQKWLTISHLYISPSIIFGKEFQYKAKIPPFFQISLGFPMISKEHHGKGWHCYSVPLIYLKYGIGF